MLTRRALFQPSEEDRDRVRRTAITWARDVTSDRSAVYLDTETTGLDAMAEIVEISVLDAFGAVLLDTLVKPQRPIPSDAEAIHGISNAMVANAPDWTQVFHRLVKIIDARRVVVYNADFDFRMVAQMNHRHRIRQDILAWQCAMQQYSGFAGDWHDRYGNFRWHKLDHAAGSFGHPPGGHRALADARACKLVVEGMAASA